MKTISTHTFKHTLLDIHKNTENRKFCFVIGSGASSKSGIPTGKELAEKWFSEIKDRYEKNEFDKWKKEEKINDKDLASHYGSIYRKRFENDKTSGYEFLVQAMKDAKPSFGHIVLAQILSRTTGHCVITTNFDSLIESSVYQFTNKTPLVCGHESLSGYARPSQTHPLIIKIHRDLLLSPKSDPTEIDKIDPGWKEPLDHIFSTHIPIIIGYGGNDGSLMSYFETMNKPSNFFWCARNQTDLSIRTKDLIEKHDGSFVKIEGFDELLHDLLLVFDEIKPIQEELNEITTERIRIATKQLDEINNTNPIDVLKPLKPKTIIKSKKEISALEYSNLARKEIDLEKRKHIYLEALEKYPTTGWLWWEFTFFLHFIKFDYINLDKYYFEAIKTNEKESRVYGNYALYLKEIKKDYPKAEDCYLKALTLKPNLISALVNYGTFLKEIKKDYKKAENYYLKALEIDNNDPDANANYAVFLKESKDLKKAEIYYLKAISVDDDANNNCNYAQFLLELGRKTESEKYLNKAFNEAIENDLLIEIWFYRYAHFNEYLKISENKIEELLAKGIRSIGWDFEGNIKQAIKEGHPNPEKLKEFARRITTD